MAQRAEPAPFLSSGPVETAVRRLVADEAAGTPVAVAPRSPLGSRALRAQAGEPARCRDLAAWLERQPWVGEVAVRPPNVYLTLPTTALREHVVAGIGPDAGRGDEGAGRVATVHTVDLGGATVRLADLRAAAVAAAVGRLLAARGFSVGDGGDRVVHVLPRDHAAPGGDGAEVAAVGLVDVPNGPLRARHGGVVWAADLVDELAAVAADGEALLRYLLLRSERTAHITLEERRLFGEGAGAWAALAAVGRAAQGPAGEGGVPERALRALLLHLDALPAAVARSASVLDPVHLVRWADGLAERVGACGDQLAGDGPVWGAVTTGLARAATLAGLAA